MKGGWGTLGGAAGRKNKGIIGLLVVVAKPAVPPHLEAGNCYWGKESVIMHGTWESDVPFTVVGLVSGEGQ